MSNEVIISLDQVTPEWLTDVLRNSGALTSGEVELFEVGTDQRLLSTSVRLKLKYKQESEGDRPQKLFLKMVNTNQEDEFFGSSEVDYYIRDYVGVEGAPLLRYYDAAYSEPQERYHILMDDLAETHFEASCKPPTLEYGLALAEGLAAMHAHWWGRERLNEIGASIPSADTINRFVGIARPGAGHILAVCADQLEAHWPDAILELYEEHPRLMIERIQDDNGFTLIHGDVNCNNVLVPIEGDRPIYIIDRQPFNWSLTTWLGAYDLAYAIILEWDVETRRQLEKPILRHYHDHLLKNGVHNYSWEQLFNDYRLSAVINVYVATEWCRGHFNEGSMDRWMPMLQKAMTAFDDLECGNLWAKG